MYFSLIKFIISVSKFFSQFVKLIYFDKFQIQFSGSSNSVDGDNDLYRNYNKIESDNNKLNESVVEGESKQESKNLHLNFDNGHHQQYIELSDSVKPVDADDENPNETQIKEDSKNWDVPIILGKLKQEKERKHDPEKHDPEKHDHKKHDHEKHDHEKHDPEKHDHENHEHHHNDRKHSTTTPATVPTTGQSTNNDPSVIGYSM